MEDYPSNSRKVNKEKEDPKKVEKVISGEAKRRKKPLRKRFAETFIGGDDAVSVWSYIVNDVLVPAAKDMVSDALREGVERVLFGESRSRGPRGRSSSSYVSYNQVRPSSPYSRREEPRREDPRREMTRRGRASHDFDEIVIDTKVEAEEVLDSMFALLEQYEIVTVADLYEMLGQTSEYTDAKYGWSDLRGSGVTRIKGGYLLDLPKPQPLD